MINNETIIYELCNKYQWFTCGSVRQYEKALTMAKGGVRWSLIPQHNR